MCLSAFCLRPPRRSSSKPLPQSPPNHPTKTEVPAVDLPRSGSDRDADGSQGARVVVSTQAGYPMNIISNHDFSNGLESWHPNCCHAYVASAISGFLNGVRPSSGGNYAVVTHRNESWQGLEQDITEKVTVSVKYTVTACVGVYGDLHGPAGVQATLKLENSDSSISYMFIERILVSKDCWEMLEGSFSLASMPRRVVFYLEGPPPGVDLLIDSVVVSSERMEMMVNTQNHVINIISNHDFSCGLEPWVPNCCHAYVASKESGFLNGVRPNSGENYAVVTQRSEWWQGLEQDITAKVTFGAIHDVSAYIGVYGVLHEPAEVKATLKFENSDSSTGYLSIGSAFVSKGCWQKLEGSFSLTSMPRRVVFYLEGPNPGMDLLIDSVTISCEDTEVCRATSVDENIVRNPQFEDGLSDWSGRGCKILLHNSLVNGKILPVKGRYFVSATERNQTWNGIEQEITGRVSRKLAYEVTAVVRTFGNANNADVRATLWAQSPNGREQYIGIAKIQASDKEWVKLQGKFLLNGVASRAIIFIEGPPPGTDILVDSFVVRRAMKAAASVPPSDEGFRDNIDSRKVVSTNIISNHDFSRGLQSWSLNLCDGFVVSGEFGPLKGVTAKTGSNYAVLTNRSESWHALEQDITNKVSTGLTYNVSVIVRVSGSHQEPSAVKATLKLEHLDSQLSYISVGRAMVSKERWEMLEGSFSLTSMPKCVIFYLEGPSAGVDLLIDSVVVSCSDVEHCEIRKRDVILKFSGSENEGLVGASLKIKQIDNCFAFGACINRSNIENEDFVDFFLKNFNWAVFGNELKWYHTESQQGKFNYKDADELLDFCHKHGKQTRGHCIFWEVEDAIQPWVQSLDSNDLMIAVQNRIRGLLSRYRGKFRHYDVNNEMLHGSFYQDRLGKDIWAYMFQEAHQLDPSAILFVNDYNVEDGCDSKSTPEKYIQQILDLQERGAPIGGIGIQGHISHPVGEIICDALDKLAILGLPIWFTELDVSAENEYIRADDLEVILREAFAHPAVEGVLLWGFWELFTCRDHSHLVDAEGNINEAGKRYLALRQEWLSHADGNIDTQGEFRFSGYHGTYTVDIATASKSISRSFIVDKGDSPLVLTIDK
ncbi:endo-1,4-beta-xylanase 1-like isoform X4 [Musa acuminata AAA Group]|uniref:endo-1,4-beta-xylanase 1-like isoform X4 n=1 Tax=Musa acuminata AAA Group TaxID=214697 RepID=UPI0031E45C62